MQQCRNWKKYRAGSPPKCNDGQGCEFCNQKYMSKIRAEMNKRFRVQESEAANKVK